MDGGGGTVILMVKNMDKLFGSKKMRFPIFSKKVKTLPRKHLGSRLRYSLSKKTNGFVWADGFFWIKVLDDVGRGTPNLLPPMLRARRLAPRLASGWLSPWRLHLVLLYYSQA